MEKSEKFKLFYDDHYEDIMEKVNRILISRGLKFQKDEQDYEGFFVFELKEISVASDK